jgi:hypothetical protein
MIGPCPSIICAVPIPEHAGTKALKFDQMVKLPLGQNLKR